MQLFCFFLHLSQAITSLYWDPKGANNPMKSRYLPAGLAVLPLLTISFIVSAADTDWVAESNKHAMLALEAQARFFPEFSGQVGVDGYDEMVLDLKPGIYERSQAVTLEVLAELEKRRATATHPAVLQDLEILIRTTKDGYHSAELQQKYMLPYFNVSQTMFRALRGLIDPQIPAERQQAAVIRLRRYAGLEDGYTPRTELAMDRTRERFDEDLLGPYKGEVEQDMGNSARFVTGIRQLFEESELEGYEEALPVLEKQLNDYIEWVKAEIVPRSRDDFRLPAELYADNLKQFGVDISPEQLIQRATGAFVDIRNEMRAIAPLVAAERGFESTDYRDVIQELKKDQIVGEDILPFFEDKLADLEAIIREKEIVTLPDRDAVIRLASEAESAAIPAPHLNPPRLIGNTGEYAEFVLPLNIPGDDGKSTLQFDDFTHDAAAWTLTVHEARPGHELQFASIIEKGVSTARVVFAFNSVNVEGWALYAEAVMKPYLPLDGQLLSLQHRLMRAARAFLDPMLNLGYITPDEVREFIMDEVVLSAAMAGQEVDRYTFRAPGQATSYFYGYTRLQELRLKTELALREKFNEQAFHDYILAQGLLPPDLLAQAVLEDFVPTHSSETQVADVEVNE